MAGKIEGALTVLGLKKKRVGKATLTAVITRADGTVEDLGVIAEGDILMTPESE